MLRASHLTERVIGCAIEVHRTLGPGLLESTYEHCLARELSLQKIRYQLQVPLPVEYKGVRLDCGYRVDVLVQQELIVELKVVDAIKAIHKALMPEPPSGPSPAVRQTRPPRSKAATKRPTEGARAR